MPTAAQYSNQGPRITVNQMVKDPLLVPRRFLQLAANEWIMEDLLRHVPNTGSGVVGYEEETPLFAADDPAIVEEGGEIPLTTGEVGIPKSVRTIKLARGVEITRETKDRNRTDRVNMTLTQVKNTFVRTWENRFFDALDAAVTQSVPAGTAWATSTTIRKVILDAVEVVAEASVAGASNSPLGFVPDALVLSRADSYDLLRSEDFSKHYTGNMADKNIQFSGKLPNQILGLNVLVSRFLTPGTAWVLERKTVGGFSDERALSATPLYEDRDRELWRSNVVRRTAVFVDQPKAACKITGI
jgi:hypothetical protein